MTSIIEEAITLASTYHAGQVDKAGRPYLGHCERVAEMVNRAGGNEYQVAAAWLHDIIEDTAMTREALEKLMPLVVVNIVVVMTHEDGVSNEDYWARIPRITGAKLVKQCDIYDNLDPTRLCYLEEATQDRLRRKYGRALQVISAS